MLANSLSFFLYASKSNTQNNTSKNSSLQNSPSSSINYTPKTYPSPKSNSLVIDNSRRLQWKDCSKCQNLLDQHKLEYLYDIEDTVYHFENQQKSAANNHIDQLMTNNHLSDHNSQLQLVAGYTELKQELTKFLEDKRAQAAKKRKYRDESSSTGIGSSSLTSCSTQQTSGCETNSSNSNDGHESHVITEDEVNEFFKQLNEKRRKLKETGEVV